MDCEPWSPGTAAAMRISIAPSSPTADAAIATHRGAHAKDRPQLLPAGLAAISIGIPGFSVAWHPSRIRAGSR
jgi:hypothetical protein